MKKSADGEVPGNAVASQAAFDRYIYKLGSAVLDLEYGLRQHSKAGNRVKMVKFKAPATDGADWLAIITIDLDGAPAVAFAFGDDFQTCLKTVANKVRNGSIQWKEDQYG